MDQPDRALMTLQELAAVGVGLSVDDFGTGYSSLAYLQRLPVNELKIDRSFVLGLANSSSDGEIVRSTVGLGHNLGLTIVAEGVEDESSLTFLRDVGCDHRAGVLHREADARRRAHGLGHDLDLADPRRGVAHPNVTS